MTCTTLGHAKKDSLLPHPFPLLRGVERTSPAANKIIIIMMIIIIIVIIIITITINLITSIVKRIIIIKLKNYFLFSTEKQSYFQTPKSTRDIAIQGFLLLKVRVAGVIECGLKCGQDSACVSFTVQSSDIRGSRLCELHNVTAESHPQSVVRKEGYQYHEVVQTFY